MEPGHAGIATKYVILLTVDGVRTQEMFGGIDESILKLDEVDDNHALRNKYWDPNPVVRREKIMPFFWSLMKSHGSIAGNREIGSSVKLTNEYRISYPGYSEILCGECHKDVNENADIQSPYKTVLEFVKDELNLSKEQVAGFCSWKTMTYIMEQTPGNVTVNAGMSHYEHSEKSPLLKSLDKLQFISPLPWDEMRHDSFTHEFAMFHLKHFQPKLFYIGYGETDDWAHDKRYDLVIDSMVLFDNCLKELWNFLESSEPYKGNTSIIITTDHGRGDTPDTFWDHDHDIDGAQHTWISFISPDSPLRGEWKNSENLYTNQIASTICHLLKLDHTKFNPKMGKVIHQIFKK